MLRLAKVIKPWTEAAALSDHINLYGFWNDHAFLTKSGDLGMVLGLQGVDYESLDGMQQGKAISIVPVMQDLTTQQAAALLGVSRPFFVKLLESGAMPFHLTGTHRRVYLKDLMAYKEHRDHERREALDQMARESEELGIYDKVLLSGE